MMTMIEFKSPKLKSSIYRADLDPMKLHECEMNLIKMNKMDIRYTYNEMFGWWDARQIKIAKHLLRITIIIIFFSLGWESESETESDLHGFWWKKCN